MLLTGTHDRTLDDKKRFVLPKRARQQLGAVKKLYVSPGPDQSLWLYDPKAIANLSAKLAQTSATDADARVFRRLFFAQMELVELDRAGRILIPDRLVAFAALEHDLLLLGVQDHLELWDARRCQNYLAQHGPRFDAVAEGAFQRRDESGRIMDE